MITHQALQVRSAKTACKINPSVLDPLSGYPEVWMIDHAKVSGTVKTEQVGELTILTPSLRQTPNGK